MSSGLVLNNNNGVWPRILTNTQWNNIWQPDFGKQFLNQEYLQRHVEALITFHSISVSYWPSTSVVQSSNSLQCLIFLKMQPLEYKLWLQIFFLLCGTSSNQFVFTLKKLINYYAFYCWHELHVLSLYIWTYILKFKDSHKG